MSAATHKRNSYTIKLKLEACEYAENLMWQVGDVLIEAGSLIQAGSPIQTGGSRAFVLIEARGLY